MQSQGGQRPPVGALGGYDPAFVRQHTPWLRRVLHGYFRARIEGLEGLADRPFLGVGTHNGSILMPDMLVWVSAYHTAGRKTPLVTLAHDLLFAADQPLSRALSRLGGVRADPEAALAALRQGYAVQVYPGGDYDSSKPFWRRHEVTFAGRRGYVRLALRGGVPIVPIVSIGAHETLLVLSDGVWLARMLGLRQRMRLAALPLQLCLPWGLVLGTPPGYLPLPAQITIRVLPAIELHGLSPRDAEDDRIVAQIDAEVRARMQAALSDMARDRIPIWGPRTAARAADRGHPPVEKVPRT